MTLKTVQASAPGNLFFLGEHAVVYGHPSLNTAVSLRTTVSMRKAEEVELHSQAFGMATATLAQGKILNLHAEREEMVPLLRLCQRLGIQYGLPHGFRAGITSEIPVESGLSSSTAVLCAMLKVMSETFGWGLNPEEYFDVLLPVQVGIHGGKASGAEILSSSIGGYNRVKKKGEKLEFEHVEGKNLIVVVGDTGIRAPTAQTVGEHIPGLMKQFPGRVEGVFKQIEELTVQGEKALATGDAERLGQLMNKNHELLVSLELSHPKLEAGCENARKAGALGAKLSGGGWGGVMFALVEKDSQDAVAAAIEQAGCRALVTDIGAEGARLEEPA